MKNKNKRAQYVRSLQRKDVFLTENGVGLRSIACHLEGKQVYSEAIISDKRSFEGGLKDLTFAKADPMDLIYVYPRQLDEASKRILQMQTSLMHNLLTAKKQLQDAQAVLTELHHERPTQTVINFARQAAECILPKDSPEELIQAVTEQLYLSASKEQ